jgi:hypothetical protein
VTKPTVLEYVKSWWLRFFWDKITAKGTLLALGVFLQVATLAFAARTVYVVSSMSATVAPAGVEAKGAVGTPTVRVIPAPSDTTIGTTPRPR